MPTIRVRALVASILLLIAQRGNAQEDTGSIKHQLQEYIAKLTSPEMQGRGYVAHGQENAAAYIEQVFKQIGLAPLPAWRQYTQRYTFPVNTFPARMLLQVDGETLKPGRDYLTDAASAPYCGITSPIASIDLATIANENGWERKKATLEKSHIWLLRNRDSLCNRLKIRHGQFAASLPAGCYLIPEQNKQMWTVADNQMAATIMYVQDSVLSAQPEKAAVCVDAKEDKSNSVNVAGYVAGEIQDSFILITAHYDHLGKMGANTYFPGASDNASGTAMMLWLASWFSKHPQRYSMLFVAFSGEEARLLGSEYFVQHLPIPGEHIRFVVNTDIMGDATNGVTVVNATEYPKEFSLLQRINSKKKYLPEIRSRGKAANSDHYHFSEAGIPAFFLYSNGGKGYYHDIFDTAESLSLQNVPGVAQMIKDFVISIQ